MKKNFRFNEYKVLIYRILLVYLFYFFARILFVFYNLKLLHLSSVSEFFRLQYYGLAFDTTAILYINALFIVFSIFPFYRNTSSGFQKFLFYLYFICNFIGYATNFIDFIYYRFVFSRSTASVGDVLQHEDNLFGMFSRFLYTYWDVFLIFILMTILWIYLYKKIKIIIYKPTNKIIYFGFSIVCFFIFTFLFIGGVRGGDFKKSTRPINLLDASRHVKVNVHADIVLNTPFAIIRTLFSNSFKKVNFVNQETIDQTFCPIKNYHNNPETKPNVVIFIIESYGKEYVGAFNKKTAIPNYKSHTPFIDSLAQSSLIFTNAYANGRQSIHGMSSVLAGIPSFKDAFTSSPYPKQKIESLVSTLKKQGYNTSFFHGAANGSMGFLGFGNILGIDDYYGRSEFNDDSQFDGSWGIWDEPFLQFMKKTLDQKKQPFLATVFTVSSHEPYNIPVKYKNKFREGQIAMHKCVEYTDFSIKRFFNQAKKQAWFANTIFVLVADHTNMIYYDEYTKQINRFAIPILIYKPNSKYIGENKELAEQIDIYPTILDMIGYPKPFRSWGRSLVGDSKIVPFVINHNGGNEYQFMRGKYICIFDGKKATGFYNINDKALTNNLIAHRNLEMNKAEESCKAFIQDYMERVIDRKL